MLLVPAVLDYAGLFVGYGGRMFHKGTQQDSSGSETTIGIVLLLALRLLGQETDARVISLTLFRIEGPSVCMTLEVVQSL